MGLSHGMAPSWVCSDCRTSGCGRATVPEVLGPLPSQSHSAATSECVWARSSRAHTALPLSMQYLLAHVHLQTVACHLWGCRVLHLPLADHPPTLRCDDDPAQVARSHSCCRCSLRRLVLGPHSAGRHGRCCAVMMTQAGDTLQSSLLTGLPQE